MLQIDPTRVQAIVAAEQPADLYGPLQGAIELEHATIPIYLTAFLSIKPGFMTDIAAILRSVFVEEMLHMCIACNVLNAIGGAPLINKPGFIPTYPGPLPMNIGDLRVHLAPLSMEQVGLFMKIEEPEVPLKFPVKTALMSLSVSYATIGQFYQALIEKIQELGDAIFKGDPSRQVVGEQWFPTTELFAIQNAAEATQALQLIVEQGEGTHKSPLSGGELAHYYRFAEIFHQKQLVPDTTEPQGFSYSGSAIKLDSSGVWNLVVDSKASQYPAGSRARTLVDQFNSTYSNLLNALHDTFDGSPKSLERAIGLMYELNTVGGQVVETTDSATGKQAAPSYEFAGVKAGQTGS
jgi:Ferritin-like